MEYFRFTLANGIRIIHKQTTSNIVHVGLMINAGSRDENENESGIAHFIEHTIFKGTSKRKSIHILNRLENVGGELNAFTTKEETCIYASALLPHFERAVELIADISQNANFPQQEIEKEKDVVIDEINSYKDNPSEEIFDEIENYVFENHPLGKNILGSPESVKAIQRENILDFIHRNYISDQMVLCSVGNIPNAKVLKQFQQYFGQIPSGTKTDNRTNFEFYQPKNIILEKGIHQAHCVLANEVYGKNHKNRAALILLNNILGGPGLNSRLNLGIREKYGFCYNIESSFTQFNETGILTIYMGTELDYLEKTIQLAKKELTKLREKKLGSLQLHYAQQQIIGQIALYQESNVNEMLAIGKSILSYDKVDTDEETSAKILQISSENLLEVANEIFAPEKISSLIYTTKNGIY